MSTLPTSVNSPDKATKHSSLAHILRRQIQDGTLKPGDKLPSYAETLALYGAHSVTLERAHSLLESEGLIVREKGRGTFVAVRDTPKTSFSVVGVAGVELEGNQGFYWAQLLAGIREAATQAEVQVMLLDLKSAMGWDKVDGAIICDWGFSDIAEFYARNLASPNTPCVSLLVPVREMPSVVADDYGGMRAATEHLLELGHRRIGFLHGDDANVIQRRRKGWLDALEEKGIRPEPDWESHIRGMFRKESGFLTASHRTMSLWLGKDWAKIGCTALLCHNDYAALGAIRAFHEAGFKVPDDVSIVGFDGVAVCEFSTPRLTSVTVPLQKIGGRAFEALREHMAGEDPPTLQTLPVRLKARQSSGPPPQK